MYNLSKMTIEHGAIPIHPEGRMGFLRLVLAVVAGTLLVGCAKTQSQSNEKPSEQDLTEAYRQAHDRGDMQAMMNLFCWDRVTPEVRKQTEDVERGTFALKIVELKLTTEGPAERMKALSYERNGTTYRFNLPVVAALAIYFPRLSPDNESVSYYAVGTKDGRYLIALMAPVERSTQGPSASGSAN
jgi:hypothetical protein